VEKGEGRRRIREKRGGLEEEKRRSEIRMEGRR
jgi:hypothetical protein